ncbi:MAG: (d)CMP kinase [Opitutales bacterium]|nr:(d)CMP kinase [Opitutales bacterium]
MPDSSFCVVAMDGGAASGKSSTAKLVAARSHFLHVDTGAHYRALTAAALSKGLGPEEGDALDQFLETVELETAINGHDGLIRLNGRIPSKAEIRAENVNAAVSRFAALPAVRACVKTYQQEQEAVARAAGFRGLVMDGRDIGTVIFPHADLKVFLVADPAERAARRARDGQNDTISDRDHLDSTRDTAPLQAAADAVVIDNSHLSLEEVVERITTLLRERGF